MTSDRKMFPRVKSVRHLGGHKLKITFTNGERGIVDFRPYITGKGGVLKPLENPAFFKQVRVDPDFKTLVWPNDADWCPDVLYWLVTGTPITWSTDTQYHKPPPHLRTKRRTA
jgi:hypothetical protein